jgi:hypothetical protein
MLLAGYAPAVTAVDSFSRPDTVAQLRASLVGCGNRYFFGDIVDSALLARAVRATRSGRRVRRAASRPSGRVYDAGEVACRATITEARVANPRFPGAQLHRVGPYSASMAAPNARAELLTSFVVDTLGRVEPGSLVILRGGDPRAASALRRGIGSYDFVPARRSGVRVRQRVIRTWVFVPPTACAEVDAAIVCPRHYRRTIR